MKLPFIGFILFPCLVVASSAATRASIDSGMDELPATTELFRLDAGTTGVTHNCETHSIIQSLRCIDF